MTPKSYEELVADVLAQLAKAEPGAGAVRIERDQRRRGKSGQEHQIDVLVEFDRFGVLFTMVVECKYWSQPVNLEKVMVLAQRLDDLAAHKGMIVTTVGFQTGAHRLGASKGIALVLCCDRPEFVIERRGHPVAGSGEVNPLVRGVFEVNYSYFLDQDDRLTHIALPMLLAN